MQRRICSETMSQFVVLYKFDEEAEATAALMDLQTCYELQPSRSSEITEVVTNYTPG